MELTSKSPTEVDTLLANMTEDELRVIYNEALRLLPSEAPIYNVTVGGMLEAQIEQLTSIARTYHEATQSLQVRLQKETIHIDNLLLETAELRKHAAARKAEVDGIYRSSSWRITAPLRKIGQLFRNRRHL